MTYLETYKRWLDSVREPELLEELNAIKDDDLKIKERFLVEMPFGTAGLRGIIGAGISRMNRYTVGRATQGLADYLLSDGKTSKSMVVAYDSRRFSREFAEETASVFAGNGIQCSIFKELTSVPELSFAVRYLHADGGVVITASHNPKEYNGYKVYAGYGGQLGPDESTEVTACIQKLDTFKDVKRVDFEEGIKSGMIIEIGSEIDRQYYQSIVALCGTDNSDGFKVVYTPLHGSGLRTAENIFPAAGIKELYIVQQQREPDGLFPTVNSPNPEDPTAMKMAIDLAKSIEADLAIGTDPDADRMGAALRDQDGNYVMLTGNQIGCLLISYLLDKRSKNNQIKPSDYIIKSFVSTDMADAIAKKYNITCYSVLTGFRYISEIITQNETTDAEFILGFEESFGYLSGTFTRDKDGVLAALMLCKAAQYYRKQGKSLLEVLETLYAELGYYLEGIRSIAFAGLDGMDKMQTLMSRLREKPIKNIGGLDVVYKEDYLSRTRTDASGGVFGIELPVTDAVKLILANNAWICIRPSGTEPKIKIYYGVCGKTLDESKSQLLLLQTEFEQMLV